jgi:hypothetical protein
VRSTNGRKRGAQEGDLKAGKLGYYSRQFRDQEIEDLGGMPASLEGEIALLRVWLRRLAESLKAESDPAILKDALLAIGMTATRIASISRANAFLTGQSKDSQAAIEEALDAATRNLGI